MRPSLKATLVSLTLLGVTACGVADAEVIPVTTTAATPVTTTTVVETTTTSSTVVELPTVPPTSGQPTTTTRPVAPPVTEPIPTTVYSEPIVEEPTVNYEPMGTNAFLECVKQRESRGDYTVVNSSSGAGGAYQFLQSTWNNTANYAGRSDLVGIHPSQASPADQDAMAIALYNWQGPAPWAGPGCG